MIQIELDNRQIAAVQNAIVERLSDIEWSEVFGPRVEAEALRQALGILNVAMKAQP